MEDVDAPPLLSMKQAPGARVELPPFETAGPLLRLDEPELPVADADESEVPSAEAMVAQLKDLRAKLDDGIAFCANMATEKDNATRAVADARRELEQLRAAPPAGRDKAAAVAERGRRVPVVSDRARATTRLPRGRFEAAFEAEDLEAGGFGIVQLVVAAVLAFLLGHASHQIPALVWDFLDANPRYDSETST